MRKVLSLLLITIAVNTTTNAQIKKGAVLLGGQIAVAYSDNNGTNNSQTVQKNNATIFNLSVGKAIKENTVIGIKAGYGGNKNKTTSGPNSYNNDVKFYNAGLFYRKYKNLGTNFYFFGEAGAGYYGTRQTINDNAGNDTENNVSGFQLSITPGIAYQVCNKLQLEVLIPNMVTAQYAVAKHKAPNNVVSKSDQFQFSTNLNGSPFNALAFAFRLIL